MPFGSTGTLHINHWSKQFSDYTPNRMLPTTWSKIQQFLRSKMWWEMTQLPMGRAECIVVTKLRVTRTTGPESTMVPPFHCCRHWQLSWLWSWLFLSAPN